MNIDKFNNILASTKSPGGGTLVSDLLPSQISYGENSIPHSARRIIINTPKETVRQKIESNDRSEMITNTMKIEENQKAPNCMLDDSGDFKLKLQFKNQFLNYDQETNHDTSKKFSSIVEEN